MVHADRPVGGWRVGDRAYCLRGSQKTVPTLEAGKVYRVEWVRSIPNHTSDSVRLAGVGMPSGIEGFWSGRFVALRGVGALGQIARATKYKVFSK